MNRMPTTAAKYLPVVAAVLVLLPFLYLAFGGADYLLATYGPVHVWFRSWEGDVRIPDPQQPYKVVMRPAQPNPNVVVICVSGGSGEQAELRSLSRDVQILLPSDMNHLRVFDWYDGDCTVEYVPGSVSGKDIRVQWMFGYE